MVDEMVLAAQRWVNQTYSGIAGYVPCAENGKTGWPTIESLTMGLQHELGISPVVDEFGPGTWAAVQAHGTITATEANKNIVKIVQSSLYCKGYDGGEIDGDYDSRTKAGVKELQVDATGTTSGVTETVSPKLLKALLSMDAFVLIGEDPYGIRAVQQWLNRTYLSRRDFFYVPCDGHPSRGVANAMLYGVQYEIGMADGVANGNFGPGTRTGLQTTEARLQVGRTDGPKRYVRLFQGAMRLNERAVAFDGTFSSAVSNAVLSFQDFTALTGSSRTGIGDYRTWAELLVSTGDTTRPTAAADVSDDNITSQARANVLVANGVKAIGRYLAGTTKIIKPGELQLIIDNGIAPFPIMQEANDAPSEFGYDEGHRQGLKAHDRAVEFSIPSGATIYFAVDYDPQSEEIDDLIIPFFKGARDGIAERGSAYAVGVYGSRNVCTVVSDAGLAVSSFVAGMSSGFSGNMGFPLPSNWAFNQIEETTMSSGGTTLSIDRNAMSGRDLGFTSLTTPPEPNRQVFDYLTWLHTKATAYKAANPSVTNSPGMLTALFLRRNKYNGPQWDLVGGGLDNGFNAYVEARQLAEGVYERTAYRDPASNTQVGLPHFAATITAIITWSPAAIPQGTLSPADFGGWAGDLITVGAKFVESGRPASEAYQWARDRIGINAAVVSSTYSEEDYIQDIDAVLVGSALLGTPNASIGNLLTNIVGSNGNYRQRTTLFRQLRFGGTSATLKARARLTFTEGDARYSTLATGLFLTEGGGVMSGVPPQILRDIADAWWQTTQDRIAAK